MGRVLWRKTIPLTAQVSGKWTRYNLDVTELMRKHPGGLFQTQAVAVAARTRCTNAQGSDPRLASKMPEPRQRGGR